MKDEYKNLREDMLDEEREIEETLERLYKITSKFDPQIKDYSIEPAMGTYLMNFYNGIEKILLQRCSLISSRSIISTSSSTVIDTLP